MHPEGNTCCPITQVGVCIPLPLISRPLHKYEDGNEKRSRVAVTSWHVEYFSRSVRASRVSVCRVSGFFGVSQRARVAVPLKAAHEWRHCEYVASVSYRVPSFVGDRWIYDVVNWSNAFETRGGPGSMRWWKSTFVGVERKTELALRRSVAIYGGGGGNMPVCCVTGSTKIKLCGRQALSYRIFSGTPVAWNGIISLT